MKTLTHALCAALLAACAWPAVANQAIEAIDSGRWQTTLRLYGWLPKVGMTTTFDYPSGGTVGLNQGQILDALQFAFMGSAAVRKGRFSVVTDLLYLNLQGDKTGPGVSLPQQFGGGFRTKLDAKLDGWVWTLGGGYTLWHNDRANVDAVLGFRLMDLTSENDLTISGPRARVFPSSHDVTISNWDAIAGVRGRVLLGERWLVPYYLDVGTGDSDLTSTGYTGIGYGFDWGALTLTYRYLHYDMPDHMKLEDATFWGPALGANFHF